MMEEENVELLCRCAEQCRVFWYGYSNQTGYGRVTRNSVSALGSLGLKIKWMPFLNGTCGYELTKFVPSALKNGIRVANLMPNRYVPSGRCNVRYTVWEASQIPPSWVEPLNREDEVWVPSFFCKEVFKDSGVTKPIHVIPHGVNISNFNPDSKDTLYPDKRFTFLWIGDNLPRKGLDIFLKAFKREFPNEPVRALVRLYYVGVITGDGPARTMSISLLSPERLTMVQEKLTSEVKSRTFLREAYFRDRIQIVTEAIPFGEMPKLYRSAQCYILSSRGEGYGLCGLEALASGLPVIYTDWGGHKEFLNENNAYPVAYRLVPVKGMPAEYEPLLDKAEWAEPDLADLQRVMRQVYEDHQTALEKAKNGVELIQNNYAWSHIARRMMERLECNFT